MYSQEKFETLHDNSVQTSWLGKNGCDYLVSSSITKLSAHSANIYFIKEKKLIFTYVSCIWCKV